MIDRETVSAKFDIIEKNLEFLGEFNAMSEEDFLGTYKNIQSAKYSLLEIMEACIDIGYHIVAARVGTRRRLPGNFYHARHKGNY